MRWIGRSLKFTGHALWQSVLMVMVVTLALGPAPAVSAAHMITAQPISPAGTPGIAWTGAMGVRETTAQIMARPAKQSLQPGPAQLFFTGRLNFGAKKNNPASAGMLQTLSTGSQAGSLAISAPNVFLPNAVNFDGPSSTLSPCGTPPDTMGAVGPTQFIITVNCNIVSYNKTTGLADGIINTTPAAFFTSVTAGAGVSDPHIRYDRTSGRWFIVIITVNFPNNRILLAVSSAATITNTTAWTFFFFQDSLSGHTTCLGDYPTPGIDANAIYIGINQFCGASLGAATYLTSDAFVVQKSSVTGAGPIHVTAFPNLGDSLGSFFTPQGVDNPDPAATEGYFIGVDFTSISTPTGILVLRRVSSPGSVTPTISADIVINVPPLGFTITQPHKGNTNPGGGTTGELDGSDGRPLAAYLRNGSLWTALDSGVASNCTATGGAISRDAVFWYELTGIPTGSTPTVHQAGSVCDTTTSNPAFYSYGTIMVNGQGHAAVGFTIAGANNFTTPGVAGRLASDPLNSLQAINVLVAGSHPYNPPFDNGTLNSERRWGDFSYTSLDPCDDMTLWTIQEYASADNMYGMRVAQLKAPPPALPATAGTVADSQASVNVTITGTSTSGSGFYDTPGSLTDACRTRIQATVSGGVTVNSVTFTDPTHVTLNLSTVGATDGPQNVTITNPDGQSATGTSILTVVPQSNPTSLVLTTSQTPSTYGQTVTFTATVTAATNSPSGSVSFSDGASLLGTGPLIGGAASFSTSALTAGMHTITASYPGNANFGSSSGTLSGGQTVNQAVATVNLGGLNQVYDGTPKAISATTVPSGLTVSFSYAGSATPPTNAGRYLVIGTINDLNYTGSANGSLVVSPANSSLTLTSSANPSVIGFPVTFTATVSSSPGLVPDGSVTITIDSSPSVVALDVSGSATLTSISLAAGTHQVSVDYAGSANFFASTAANLTQAVLLATYIPVIIH